ncbi:MAG TPA: hypothetical protein VE338_04765, partial [Ktedonobacterales bacterium]|nr:hypothetical protein [Ktedonobacterales bacterium]
MTASEASPHAALDAPDGQRTSPVLRAQATDVGLWSGPRSQTLPKVTLESGETLAPVTVAYETWGRLAP